MIGPEAVAAPWWVRRGLAKDPEDMTPEEKDAAQLVLLQQWLWRIGAESSAAQETLQSRELQRMRRRSAKLMREQRGAA